MLQPESEGLEVGKVALNGPIVQERGVCSSLYFICGGHILCY